MATLVRAPSSRTDAPALRRRAAATAPTNNALLAQIVSRLPDPVAAAAAAKKEGRRQATRHHLAEVGGALSIVAALVGSGLLAVLLSPAWTQAATENAGGVCKDWGDENCEMWRSVLGVTASLSFVLTMITLLLTIGVVLGLGFCLNFAIIAFILSLDAMAVALIATSWLAYEAEPAYLATACMLLLILVTFVALIPGFLYTWYRVRVGRLKRKTRKQDNKIARAREGLKHAGAPRFPGHKQAPTPLNLPPKTARLIATTFPAGLQQLERGKKDHALVAGFNTIHRLAFFGRWYHRLLMRMLLSEGQDVTLETDYDFTPLMIAVLMNTNVNGLESHKRCISILESEGADVDRGRAARLHRAAITGDQAALSTLVIEGCKPEYADKFGYRALHYAVLGLCWRGNESRKKECMQFVKDLIFDYRVDVNAATQNGCTSLMLAALIDDADLLKVLLRAGADANKVHSNGATALIMAARGDFYDASLLRSRAVTGALLWRKRLETKIDVIDDTGMTALLWFIMAGNVDMVDLLLKEGANIEALDFEGRTPLMWVAANVNRQPQVLEFASRLLKHHAQVHVADYNGDTALILAADNIVPGVVRVLLESCADVNFANDSDGTTALLRAAGNRNSDIMNMLLEKDAKFEICDKKGFTPVMAAAKHGQETNLRKLLSLGADAKAIDCGEYTALKYALENKKAGAVRILVEHGAHVGTADLDAGEIFLSLLGDGAAHGLGAKEEDNSDGDERV